MKMSSKNFNFSLMLGLSSNDEMPEDLQLKLSRYLEQEKAPEIEDGLDNIVKEYCKEHNFDIPETFKQRRSSRKGWISDDESEIQEYSKEETLERLSEFFGNIGKKRGIEKKKESTQTDIEKVKELEDTLHEMISQLDPNSSEEDKSKAAYKILEFKIKAARKKFHISRKDLEDSLLDNVEEIKKLIKGDSNISPDKKEILAKTERETQRVAIILEQAMDTLDKILVSDYDEYNALSSEEKLNFLKYGQKELTDTVDFVDTEFETIKTNLQNILSAKLNLGPHLEAVL